MRREVAQTQAEPRKSIAAVNPAILADASLSCQEAAGFAHDCSEPLDVFQGVAERNRGFADSCSAEALVQQRLPARTAAPSWSTRSAMTRGPMT
jgi:hypothetical protein